MLRKEDLKLSSYEHINGLQKQICDRCKKSRMYYCYDCRIPLPGVFTPNVKVHLDYYILPTKLSRLELTTIIVFTSSHPCHQISCQCVPQYAFYWFHKIRIISLLVYDSISNRSENWNNFMNQTILL